MFGELANQLSDSQLVTAPNVIQKSQSMVLPTKIASAISSGPLNFHERDWLFALSKTWQWQ